VEARKVGVEKQAEGHDCFLKLKDKFYTLRLNISFYVDHL